MKRDKKRLMLVGIQACIMDFCNLNSYGVVENTLPVQT